VSRRCPRSRTSNPVKISRGENVLAMEQARYPQPPEPTQLTVEFGLQYCRMKRHTTCARGLDRHFEPFPSLRFAACVPNEWIPLRKTGKIRKNLPYPFSRGVNFDFTAKFFKERSPCDIVRYVKGKPLLRLVNHDLVAIENHSRRRFGSPSMRTRQLSCGTRNTSATVPIRPSSPWIGRRPWRICTRSPLSRPRTCGCDGE
jgi:hypothetical protein